MEQLFHSHTSSLIYSNAIATQLICSTCVTLLNLCLTVLVFIESPCPPLACSLLPVIMQKSLNLWTSMENHAQNNDLTTLIPQCWAPSKRTIHMIKTQITLLQRDFRLSHQFVICCQARSRLWFFFKSNFCLLPILKFRGHLSKTKKCKSTLLQRLLQRTSFLNQQVCIPKSSVIAIAFTSKFSNRQPELDLLKW